MRAVRLLAGLALAALLAGCAPAVRIKGNPALLREQAAREQQLAHVDSWTLEGRLGVSDGHHGGSGDLRWTQRGDDYEFVLRGPAISGANFRLTGGPGGALLEGLEGGPLRGRSAEALMRKALGWELPLDDLRAWVLGLRADGSPARLSFGTDRLPALLQQDGWAVDYREWDQARQPALPKKVYAEKPPYKVRLSIDTFRLQNAASPTAGRHPSGD